MRLRRRAEEASPVELVFAGVLDGRRLWLAVDEQPGRLALRSASGDVLDLPASDADAQPGRLAVRLDLAALPAAAASYDVVLVGPDGTVPLTTGPLAAGRVVATDGVRHLLERADDGALRLRTEVLAPSATLVSVAVAPDELVLEVTTPAGPVTLTGGDLAVGPVLVGPDRLPVRRRDDDLPDPGRGAPLPSHGSLRLRWNADGLLVARAVET